MGNVFPCSPFRNTVTSVANANTLFSRITFICNYCVCKFIYKRGHPINYPWRFTGSNQQTGASSPDNRSGAGRGISRHSERLVVRHYFWTWTKFPWDNLDVWVWYGILADNTGICRPENYIFKTPKRLYGTEVLIAALFAEYICINPGPDYRKAKPVHAKQQR